MSTLKSRAQEIKNEYRKGGVTNMQLGQLIEDVIDAMPGTDQLNVGLNQYGTDIKTSDGTYCIEITNNANSGTTVHIVPNSFVILNDSRRVFLQEATFNLGNSTNTFYVFLQSVSGNDPANLTGKVYADIKTVGYLDEMTATREKPILCCLTVANNNIIYYYGLPALLNGKKIGSFIDNLPPQVTVDSELSETSENPVQNCVVKAAIDNVRSEIPTLPTIDSELSDNSTNPVQNCVVKAAIDSVRSEIPALPTIDSALSITSENAVENKVLTKEILFSNCILEIAPSKILINTEWLHNCVRATLIITESINVKYPKYTNHMSDVLIGSVNPQEVGTYNYSTEGFNFNDSIQTSLYLSYGYNKCVIGLRRQGEIPTYTINGLEKKIADIGFDIWGNVTYYSGIPLTINGVVMGKPTTVDSELSATSANPVENRVITARLNDCVSQQDLENFNENIQMLVDVLYGHEEDETDVEPHPAVKGLVEEVMDLKANAQQLQETTNLAQSLSEDLYKPKEEGGIVETLVSIISPEDEQGDGEILTEVKETIRTTSIAHAIASNTESIQMLGQAVMGTGDDNNPGMMEMLAALQERVLDLEAQVAALTAPNEEETE